MKGSVEDPFCIGIGLTKASWREEFSSPYKSLSIHSLDRQVSYSVPNQVHLTFVFTLPSSLYAAYYFGACHYSFRRSNVLPLNLLTRHMLLMAWAGTETTKLEHTKTLLHEIARSKKEIHALGVVHGDFRFENILWNAELGRALIIEFHRSKLDRGWMKRPSCGKQGSVVKRLRVA